MDHDPADQPNVENRQGGTTASEAQAEPGAAPDSISSLPRVLPVLPVRDVVVFPGTVVPLTIAREKSKLLLDAVLGGDKRLAIFTQRQSDVDDPRIDDIYRVGTAAHVLKLLRMPDGTHSLLVHGTLRVGLERFTETDPFWSAAIVPHEDRVETTMQLEALMYSARRTAEQVIEMSPNVPDEALQILRSIDGAGSLADFLAANLSLGVVQKQELLETFDVADRLRKINATLQNQLEVLELSKKIQSDVRREVDKTQREYFLHQQMKAIQKELGEDDPRKAELDELRERVEGADMPQPVLKEAQHELDRLQRISPASPENGVIRDYLDWLIAMPWTQRSEDNLDLHRAEEILDSDHYGLKKVKRRILEYLAVRKLNPNGKSPILCFTGPPGVGKTSLGKSIARALGRKFIRIALGGIRDEADIRGHRRTYIGAVPGRIIQELRKAGTRNPVIMLDELDKMGADFRGDPSSALLEVLDPEQNHSFTDHYLSVPFDLSDVMFIGTANYMDPVEPALFDRMEVIELGGYTTAEKLEIAQRYLLPRQLKRTGLADQKISFGPDALRHIIDSYTYEAGVRGLERSIGSVCRSMAAKVARDESIEPAVDVAAVETCLGPPRFEHELALEHGIPGIATALAYTAAGGDILFIEAAIMPGRGNFTMTGHIGDVMRESGAAALSVIRSRADEWGVKLDQLHEMDIHVHVPAGAVPKDGPSAGVSMLTSLFTMLTETVADPSVGMTGEITLRGRVLPVGGVKEKVLAAHRAGLKTVILPKQNERDLEDVPDQVREQIKFVFAETVEDVLLAAIPGLRETAERAKPTKRVKKKRSKRTTKKRAVKKRAVKKRAPSRKATGSKRAKRRPAKRKSRR